jgi:hypothetical protein
VCANSISRALPNTCLRCRKGDLHAIAFLSQAHFGRARRPRVDETVGDLVLYRAGNVARASMHLGAERVDGIKQYIWVDAAFFDRESVLRGELLDLQGYDARNIETGQIAEYEHLVDPRQHLWREMGIPQRSLRELVDVFVLARAFAGDFCNSPRGGVCRQNEDSLRG